MTGSDYDLAAIMAHPKYPFADWQKDDISFLMLELFWAELLRNVLGPEKSAEWTPRFDTERDGNPIFAVCNKTTGRAFRVIVVTNEFELPVYPDAVGGDKAYYYFSAFLDVADELDGSKPMDEMGFFVELHPSILDVARRFLELFCVDHAPLEDMEALFAEYETKVGMDQISE